jgi:uncharacterized protein (DUF302 family)
MKKILVALLLLFHGSLQAESVGVFEYVVNKPMQQVYDQLYKGLEDENFYVVFEVDIGKNLSRFANKWGDNYNRSQLDSIRGMVFCNGWYANAVSNVDPSMMALCPLHVSLIEKDAKTTVLFARPTVIAKGSQAFDIAQRIENDVIATIEKSLPVN